MSVGQSDWLPMMMPTTAFAVLIFAASGRKKARDYRSQTLKTSALSPSKPGQRAYATGLRASHERPSSIGKQQWAARR
ncbi:protein of unknown function [Hyphomicrobium sp. 1Nfss2.1]